MADSLFRTKSIESLLAEAHGAPIDLLLSDLVMRLMNGKQLLAQLRARHPGLRAMFLTAHTDHAVVDAEVADPSARLLRKPCRPRTLLHAVRECLDDTGVRPGDAGDRR